jgi:hypothetical protein
VTGERGASAIVSAIREAAGRRSVVAGFDGFVDTICRAVREREPSGRASYFRSMRDLGGHLLAREGGSATLELETLRVKPGGNMPITAHALGCLGFRVDCIGALGEGRVDPVFEGLSPNCRLHPVARPGSCTSVELDGGKLMLADTGDLDSLGWDRVEAALGAGTVRGLLAGAHLLALLNWSELRQASGLWEGVIAAAPAPGPQRRRLLVDLADCGRRADEDIVAMLGQLSRLGRSYATVLSLNGSEMTRLVRHLGQPGLDPTDGPSALARRVTEARRGLPVDVLLLHTPRLACYADADGSCVRPSRLVASPSLSTGAGDNFNAGFGAGLLADLEPAECLRAATACASFYVERGRSVEIGELAACIEAVPSVDGEEGKV